ncbi:DUF1294 domain-containing protein [Bacillus sp. DX1.1]|uniref:DUF1294 domain-containing protein n=1 Tax=unclassified Bacillus (in: firmicutes) TaxID=185979 RepID=UPI00256FAE1A|nr:MULTISPECIES: DUF1294 domain-containing protein [unclassified Bacillus (in: firmicutes)]MDM5155715.1 DUF1294 domain-containing protein [Bacillus sp. DX1.1]WJE80016.1 DUF1294 domain-containing protein [Bacillus sp. DX3.1]
MMVKWLYVLCINLIAFSMMGLDKRKAKKKQWRTPENTLFLVSAAGGALGAWIGMYIFHHKTHKNKFKIGIPILVVVTAYLFWIL